MKRQNRSKWCAKLSGLTMLALLLFNLAFVQPVHAATITVNSTADTLTPGDDQCTLREAIMNANLLVVGDTTGEDCMDGGPGADIIILPAGVYTLSISGAGEDANASGDLDILDDLTISGAGARSTIIDANGAVTLDRAFHFPIAVTVQINNVTIQNGDVSSSIGADGGGLLIEAGSNVTINDSRLTNNLAYDDGGAFLLGNGTVTVNRSLIDNNQSGPDGSATGGAFTIYPGPGTVTVNHSTISGNSADNSGGAIYNQGGTLNLNHATVTDNSDNIPGGAGGGVDGIIFDLAIGGSTQNSIISGNGTVDCGVGNGTPITSAGYNVVGSNNSANGCPSGGTGDQIVSGATITILDTTLADNGGPTDTHALVIGGIALDQMPSGTNGCGTPNSQDQRGATRPTDADDDGTSACDVGAFELGGLQCGIQSAGPATYTFFGNVDIEITTVGTNLECLRVTDIPWDHPNASGGGSVVGLMTGKYWIIDALQSDGSTVASTDYISNLTLPYTGADMNTRACKWLEGTGPGGGWDCDDGTNTTFVANTSVTRSDISSYSDWSVGDTVGPTAVTLESFSAASQSIIMVAFMVGVLFLAFSSLWLRQRMKR